MKYLVLVLIAILTACSQGGHWQHYRISAFIEARDRSMPIYLHFFEQGASFCDKQKSELEEIIKDKKFAKVGAYRVMWNSEKSLQEAYRITEPCAVLVFVGSTIKTRVTSDVGPELLKRTLEQGL